MYLPTSLAKQVTITTPKLTDLSWQPFEQYTCAVQRDSSSFTKTAQFYIFNPQLLALTRSFFKLVATEKQLVPISTIQLETKLLRSEFYQYENEVTVIVNEYRNSYLKEILVLQNGELIEQIDNVLYHVVFDTKHSDSLMVEALCQDGQVHRWDGNNLRKERVISGADLKYLAKARRTLYAKIAGPVNDDSRINNILTDHCRALEAQYYQLTRGFLNSKDQGASILTPTKLHLVCMPGTFDPPHIGHVRVLADAMMQISKALQESNIIGYLVPIGDKAPGPDGRVWKHGTKNTFNIRHNLCSETVNAFAPIIRTTDFGRKYPTLYGLELCFLLAQDISASFLHIVAGVDTWERWQQSFYNVLHCSSIIADSMVTQLCFWIQPRWGETVTCNGYEELGANILEPTVPYFVHSSEISKRGLDLLTVINDSHFSEIYTQRTLNTTENFE